MASEWTSVTLGEVTKWLSGGTPNKATPEFWNGDIPWISANSMHDIRIDDSDLKITLQGLKSGSRWAKKDSVLLLVRGGALHNRLPVGIATRDVAFNQDVKALVADETKLDPWFLLYWLLANQEFLLESIVEFTGIGAGKLDTKRMQALEVKLPPLEVQREILGIVKTLDDRIDNLRRTNATLQAISSALFKSWFVDFAQPVGANNYSPLHHSPLHGVPQEDMQESELGLIPKGWRVASLDAIADYLNGLALQKFPPESETEFLPVIKIAQLRAGNTDGADRASARIKSEYIVEDGDVLFSWSGSLEVEVGTGGRGALNQHLFKITSREVPKWFYYFATRQHLADFRAIAAGKATTMGHIQRGHLSAAKVAVPPPDEMAKADAVITPLFEQKINNALQARTLAALRDTLLPRLISGKLRVGVGSNNYSPLPGASSTRANIGNDVETNNHSILKSRPNISNMKVRRDER